MRGLEALLLQPNRRTSSIGYLLGANVGEGLNALLQDKLQQMRERQDLMKQVTGLSALGLAPQESLQISMLSPKLQELVIKNYLAGAEREGLGQALQSLLGGAPQEQPPQAEQPPAREIPAEQQAELPPEQQKELSTEQTALAKSIMQPRLSPQMQLQLANLGLQQKREELQEKQMALRDTREFRTRISKAAADAADDLQNIKTQLDMVKKGRLGGRVGAFYNVLLDAAASWLGKEYGLHLTEQQKQAFKTDPMLLFEQNSVRYLRSLKDTFGARPTQWDAQQIMKSYPSLYQSDEGKEAILQDMAAMAKVKIKKQKIMNEIIRENKGIPPIDLEEKIATRLRPYQNKLYKETRDRINTILSKTGNMPTPESAKKLGRGTIVENDKGLKLISTGKDWVIAYSDTIDRYKKEK